MPYGAADRSDYRPSSSQVTPLPIPGSSLAGYASRCPSEPWRGVHPPGVRSGVQPRWPSGVSGSDVSERPCRRSEVVVTLGHYRRCGEPPKRSRLACSWFGKHRSAKAQRSTLKVQCCSASGAMHRGSTGQSWVRLGWAATPAGAGGCRLPTGADGVAGMAHSPQVGLGLGATITRRHDVVHLGGHDGAHR